MPYVDFSSSHNAGGYLGGSATFTTRVYYTTSYDYATDKTTVSITDVGVSHDSGLLWGSMVFVGGVKVNNSYAVKMTNVHRVSEGYVGSGTEFTYTSPLYGDDSDGSGPKSITVSGTKFTITIDDAGTGRGYCAYRYNSRYPVGAAGQSKQVEAVVPYRASTVIASNANIGSATTITINRDYNNLTHTLQYKIAGQSSYTTLTTKTSAVSYSWTIPTSTYDYVSSSSKQVSITINCITYNGSVLIGSNTTTITAYCVESECQPTVSATYTLLNNASALTGNNTTAVLNWSNVKITVSATAKHGASISSYAIIHNGATTNSNTATYNKIQVGTFTYRATDSRGYVKQGQIVLTVIPYFTPTITMQNVSPDIQTNIAKTKCAGNVFTGSFGAVSNTTAVSYRYKVDGGSYSSWIALTPTSSSNKYTTSWGERTLDYRNKYIFQARVVDKLNTITTAEVVVRTLPLFDWNDKNFNFNIPILLSGDSYGSTLPSSGIEGQIFIKI